MKKKLMTVLLGTSLILTACGGGDNAGQKEDGGNSSENTSGPSSNGEKLFQRSCSSCHGEKLEGGFGPKLTNVGAEHSQEEIEGIIKNGKGQMPGNILKGEDAKAVAEWLASKK
ncbi:cytochrome c551 [Peribacillus sp. SCS-37]|uniref:cytochrome c551 n=1 Tax=Paraperibacillus esterisolvens TaxID=3115296 RepID=UPI0039066807